MRKTKYKNKPDISLNGFTILEILFVILLTGIVIMLAMLYFETFQRYYRQINDTANYETEVLRMDGFLQYDLDRSQYIILNRYDPALIECKGTDINYKFNNDGIIRYQSETSDTLHVENLVLETSMYEQSDTLIESVQLKFTGLNKRERQYSFIKLMDENVKFKFFKQQNH